MKKKLLFACFAATGIFSASTALAAPTWIDDDVFSLDVKPAVVKTSTLSVNASNTLTSEGNIGPNQLLFTLNISATPETKIALGAINEYSTNKGSSIRSTGEILSNAGPANRRIGGLIPDEYKSMLTNNSDYFPTGASMVGNANVILLSGEELYAINVTTSDSYSVEDYIHPGTYTFSFVAQAYTE
ncbi:Uncharacterised protein [Cedecea neteri]|uniref:Uncharacterized protein n=1 Tax=Cedecea neteri TaxID=158822 RepID=A0A291DW92_9ENTR|nr:hypothetical protein [Cedecea neteri]ATF92087.1 hypothetical protein CO704_08320 [Cedecea neteri]SQC90740.1 Uncharacterised protein [Cedecea neteri]